MNEKNSFEYSYISPERKMTADDLRRDMPKRQTSRPMILALILGLVSCLVFGSGLSLILVWSNMIPGLLLGVLGIAGMAITPAFYRCLISRKTKNQ